MERRSSDGGREPCFLRSSPVEESLYTKGLQCPWDPKTPPMAPNFLPFGERLTHSSPTRRLIALKL